MTSRFGTASFGASANGNARGYGAPNAQAQRSKEAPMDYQWTNRSSAKPAWATGGAGGDGDTSMGDESPSVGLSTPRKRSHDTLAPSTPSLSGTPQPTFGSNQNVPFLFQPTHVPQTPVQHPWAPPTSARSYQPEVRDVDMNEASPVHRHVAQRGTLLDYSPMKEDDGRADERSQAKTGDNEESALEIANGKARSRSGEVTQSSRQIASGALRRVFKQRTSRRPHARRRRHEGENHDHGSESEEGEESDDEGMVVPSLTQKTQNFINLHAPVRNETPYVLLGYLQFFFNLSLILIFLYLCVQFIITVQRDVGHRISEYSQGKYIIQEIAMCALQFKNNRCDNGDVIPAMIAQCASWETCMNRDPSTVGRARVGAELIAEVVNGFVEPISWKTLIFTLTSLAFLTVFINTLLSLYRSKHQPVPEHATSAAAFPLNPAGSYYHLPPNNGWSGLQYRPEEDMEAPARRRRLDGGGAAKVK
ncbi:hypothetical protein D9619_003310 [Psilocybe cf. subviscida]|uniref:Brl1/Brr6 domain-containing protein n=1 Tax=Psilocybe cf. subviscida TaxID=2480587 RepID=A0A8H5AY75_9AGAR|nr:hypothetical protein D9619_003310 [Psilocybe cf. subviscida]